MRARFWNIWDFPFRRVSAADDRQPSSGELLLRADR